jgi:hypothetical protein
VAAWKTGQFLSLYHSDVFKDVFAVLTPSVIALIAEVRPSLSVFFRD